MNILKSDCTPEDILKASKEVLFYTWKAIANGKSYPDDIVILIASEMTLLGM